jgi:hypothetical protein
LGTAAGEQKAAGDTFGIDARRQQQPKRERAVDCTCRCVDDGCDRAVAKQ